MTFTKEQLIAAAHGRIDFANMMLSDNPEPLKERMWSIELELARIALSALRERAEPVGWTDEQELRDVNERGCGYLFTVNPITPHADPRRVIKLYAEPPAPVVPDDTKRLDWLDAQNKRLNEYYGTYYGWKFDANFQRNAMMLNDSNYPVMTVRQAIDEAMLAAPGKEG
ncbi:hypothetical protein ACKS9G_001962 [Cronobacter turicensis]